MKNMLLLIGFASLFVLIIGLIIMYIRKRDTKLLLVAAVLLIIIFTWGMIFDESIDMGEYLMWLICFSVITGIVIFGYIYSEKKSKLTLALSIALSVFWLFTFCTETGSIRLAIALKGYPDIAYTTNLIENTYMRKNNISYYISGKLIETENGTLSFFECHNYGFLKISGYCD